MSDLKRALEAETEVKRLRHVIKRLEAAQGWQPIETAPKDGTRVLFCGTAIYIGCYANGQFWDSNAYRASPTDWQPLPAAAKATP
jgi:hypothetical protein